MGNSVHVLSSHLTSCYNIKLMFMQYCSHCNQSNALTYFSDPVDQEWVTQLLESDFDRRKYQWTETGLNEIKLCFGQWGSGHFDLGNNIIVRTG